MKTAADRIQKFLDEHAKMRNHDPEQICGLHAGHPEREAILLVSDLREVLSLARRDIGSK